MWCFDKRQKRKILYLTIRFHLNSLSSAVQSYFFPCQCCVNTMKQIEYNNNQRMWNVITKDRTKWNQIEIVCSYVLKLNAYSNENKGKKHFVVVIMGQQTEINARKKMKRKFAILSFFRSLTLSLFLYCWCSTRNDEEKNKRNFSIQRKIQVRIGEKLRKHRFLHFCSLYFHFHLMITFRIHHQNIFRSLWITRTKKTKCFSSIFVERKMWNEKIKYRKTEREGANGVKMFLSFLFVRSNESFSHLFSFDSVWFE